MNVQELIKIADDAYEDGVVQAYFEDRDGNHGDTLAKFIAVELEETWDDGMTEQEQRAEAVRVLSNAINELTRVRDAFSRHYHEDNRCCRCGREDMHECADCPESLAESEASCA